MIVGIVVALLVVAIAAAVLIVMIMRRKDAAGPALDGRGVGVANPTYSSNDPAHGYGAADEPMYSSADTDVRNISDA